MALPRPAEAGLCRAFTSLELIMSRQEKKSFQCSIKNCALVPALIPLSRESSDSIENDPASQHKDMEDIFVLDTPLIERVLQFLESYPSTSAGGSLNNFASAC
jgi:hypothetical protein